MGQFTHKAGPSCWVNILGLIILLNIFVLFVGFFMPEPSPPEVQLKYSIKISNWWSSRYLECDTYQLQDFQLKCFVNYELVGVSTIGQGYAAVVKKNF